MKNENRMVNRNEIEDIVETYKNILKELFWLVHGLQNKDENLLWFYFGEGQLTGLSLKKKEFLKQFEELGLREMALDIVGNLYADYYVRAFEEQLGGLEM